MSGVEDMKHVCVFSLKASYRGKSGIVIVVLSSGMEMFQGKACLPDLPRDTAHVENDWAKLGLTANVYRGSLSVYVCTPLFVSADCLLTSSGRQL